MHSRLFQIEEELEHRMEEYEISIEELQRHDSSIDYFGVADQNGEEDLEWLESCLPDGMFERNGNELTYKKYPKEHFEEKLSTIKEMAEGLTLDDISNDSIKVYRLKQVLVNNRNSMLVCSEENGTECLDEWCSWVAGHYKIGQKFYVGTIFDYHA